VLIPAEQIAAALSFMAKDCLKSVAVAAQILNGLTSQKGAGIKLT
jgi:hypothetical protein